MRKWTEVSGEKGGAVEGEWQISQGGAAGVEGQTSEVVCGKERHLLPCYVMVKFYFQCCCMPYSWILTSALDYPVSRFFLLLCSHNLRGYLFVRICFFFLGIICAFRWSEDFLNDKLDVSILYLCGVLGCLYLGIVFFHNVEKLSSLDEWI